MKIIVMSDSHGDKETVKAVSELPADAHFHCGDSELPFDDPVIESMNRVRGNCDFDAKFPKEFFISVGGKTILAVHGHEHNIKSSMLELYYRAKEIVADVVLFGHSHLYGAEMIDEILFVNPGSTIHPRGGKDPTYALIEWEEYPIVTFYNTNHVVVDLVALNIIGK